MYSFLSEKKKKRFVSGQATTKLGNPYKSLRKKLGWWQFWFVWQTLSSSYQFMFDAKAILICCFRCTFRGFLSHGFGRYVLCRAEKYAQIAINLLRIKSIFRQISSTNSRNWIFQPQKESSTWSGKMSESLDPPGNTIFLRRVPQSTILPGKKCLSILNKLLIVGQIVSSTQPQICLREKSKHWIYCSLKLLTFQSLLWRAPLEKDFKAWPLK